MKISDLPQNIKYPIIANQMKNKRLSHIFTYECINHFQCYANIFESLSQTKLMINLIFFLPKYKFYQQSYE
jgi:hypothetical protein